MPRKLLFVLPNLFTASSIFCGVYAIIQATAGSAATGETAANFYFRAAIAIFFGGFFDGMDGRVARMTKTESDFGVQLDSLADVVTFGVAPAILLYDWALAPMGTVGVLIAGIYTTCGALRLARFNVMASREIGPSNYFTGLPIPFGAGVVVAIVVAVTKSPTPIPVSPMPIAVVSILVSWLMVSTVKYHSFKKVKLHSRELLIIGAVLVSGALIGTRLGANFVLLAYATLYVLLGLFEEVFFRKQRRAMKRAMLASSNSHREIVVEEDELEDDEDPSDDLDA